MNLADFTLQSFRFLLLPFSLIYGLAIWIRNRLYDRNILTSVSFNLPIICVGNLRVGGTGKSPMIEYLIRILKEDYAIATLSRGYKRKTKGYAIANEHTTALDIGDEPMQFHLKFPEIAVAVGESRVEAIPQLLHDRPDTRVILLDDAFQHRKIRPGLSIVLTEAEDLFTRDFFLPTGDLRDEKKSYERADLIMVTKCPSDLPVSEKNEILREINPKTHQEVYFSTIEYQTPVHILNKAQTYPLHKNTEVLLVTGIANTRPLEKYIQAHAYTYVKLAFGDHHIFTIDDLAEIKHDFDQMDHPHKIILTTEKDAVRLEKFKEQLEQLPIYVLPIQHRILFDEENNFREKILAFIDQFEKPDTHV